MPAISAGQDSPGVGRELSVSVSSVEAPPCPPVPVPAASKQPADPKSCSTRALARCLRRTAVVGTGSFNVCNSAVCDTSNAVAPSSWHCRKTLDAARNLSASRELDRRSRISISPVVGETPRGETLVKRRQRPGLWPIQMLTQLRGAKLTVSPCLRTRWDPAADEWVRQAAAHNVTLS